MAISYIGSGTKTAATNATITPPLPAGTQAGDILCIVGTTYGVPTIAASGYTAKISAVNGTYTRVFLLWKRHSGSESAPSVTGATNAITAQVLAFRGVDTGVDPWDSIAAAATTGNDLSIEFPSLTTGVDGALILAVGGNRDNNTSAAATSYGNLDASNRGTDFYYTGLGSDCCHVFYWGTLATAGSIGSPVATLADITGTLYWVAHVAALKPASTTTAVAQTLTPTYSVRQFVAQTLSPTYAIRSLIAQTLSPTYNVRQIAAQTLTPAYGVRNLAAQTITPTYLIRQFVAQSLTPAYDVRTGVAQTLAPTYSMRQTVAGSLTPVYDIQAVGLTGVAQTLTPIYSLRQFTSKTLTPTYAMRNLAAQTLTSTYLIRELAAGSLSPTYDVRQLVAATITSTYDVRGLVAAVLTPTYDVRQLAGASLAPLYDILSLLGPIITLELGEVRTRWTLQLLTRQLDADIEASWTLQLLTRRLDTDIDTRWRIGAATTRRES